MVGAASGQGPVQAVGGFSHDGPALLATSAGFLHKLWASVAGGYRCPIRPTLLGSIGDGRKEPMESTTISTKYQVVLPKAVRERYQLKPGQTLQLISLPDRIELVPLQPPAALRGFLKGGNSFEREPDRL